MHVIVLQVINHESQLQVSFLWATEGHPTDPNNENCPIRVPPFSTLLLHEGYFFCWTKSHSGSISSLICWISCPPIPIFPKSMPVDQLRGSWPCRWTNTRWTMTSPPRPPRPWPQLRQPQPQLLRQRRLQRARRERKWRTLCCFFWFCFGFIALFLSFSRMPPKASAFLFICCLFCFLEVCLFLPDLEPPKLLENGIMGVAIDRWHWQDDRGRFQGGNGTPF